MNSKNNTPTNEQIISLLDNNDLEQLQVVLGQISLNTHHIHLHWADIMEQAVRMDRIEGIQLLDQKTKEIFGAECFFGQYALVFSQSAAMVNFILDEIERVSPQFDLSDTVNDLMATMAMNGGVEALKAMMERVDPEKLSPYEIKEGMLAAIATQKIEKVDVFVPLMDEDEEGMTEALSYAARAAFEPMIDHLYTLERAQYVQDILKKYISFDNTSPPGVAYLYRKMMADLSKQEIEHQVNLSGQQPAKTSKM